MIKNNMPNNSNDNLLQIPCEIYTRCVGYYRPLNQMNKGKKSEVKQRKMLTVPNKNILLYNRGEK